MCSPSEEKFIDEWFASISTKKKPFDEGRDIDTVKERSWERVNEYVNLRENRRPSLRHVGLLRWSVIGVAASLVAVLSVGWYFFESEEIAEPVLTSLFNERPSNDHSIKNDGARMMEFFLADQSRIQLLPGSSIRFTDAFGSAKREVFLEGEAFFEVTPDEKRPFLVYTQDLTTEVLGTSFLIRAYSQQEEIVVTVKTGKVSVYTNSSSGGPRQTQSHQEVILTPNQQVVYNAGEQLTLRKLVSEPQIILPEPTLKDSYTNAPVIDILKNLEENYGIDVRYDAAVLSNCTLTSDMSDEGFYEQIKIICNALGAQYKIEETAVVIEAAGCSSR